MPFDHGRRTIGKRSHWDEKMDHEERSIAARVRALFHLCFFVGIDKLTVTYNKQTFYFDVSPFAQCER